MVGSRSASRRSAAFLVPHLGTDTASVLGRIAIALLDAGVHQLVIHDADESRLATLMDLLLSGRDVRRRCDRGARRGHGVTPFLQAAEFAGCKTANGGHLVEVAQDVMADFMLWKADSSTVEGRATPMLASP
jgi:hypothetical protein